MGIVRIFRWCARAAFGAESIFGLLTNAPFWAFVSGVVAAVVALLRDVPWEWAIPIAAFTAASVANLALRLNEWRFRTATEGRLRIVDLRAIWAPYTNPKGEGFYRAKVKVNLYNSSLMPIQVEITNSYAEIGNRVPAVQEPLSGQAVILPLDTMEYTSGAVDLDSLSTPIDGKFRLEVRYGHKKLDHDAHVDWLLSFERDESGYIQVRGLNKPR